MIKRIKETRVVILSTQHIEEAENLADRIVVMSHGKLIVHDSAENIKKTFGVGYSIILEHNNAEEF